MELRNYKGGLKRYIETHLSEALRLVPMQAYGGGVVPREPANALSDEELEALYVGRRATLGEARRPSYYPPIWWAFKNPFEEGERRYVSVVEGGGLTLHRLEPGKVPEADWLEIKPEEVLEPDSPGAPIPFERVAAAIQSWADGKIETSKLIIPSAARTAQGKGAQGSGSYLRNHPGSLTGLIAGLKGFTKDELSRINIPADVMLSFLERSSRGR